MNLVRKLMLLCFALLAAPAAMAQEEVPLPPAPTEDTEGVAFLLISLSDTFEYGGESSGSQMIVVPLGIFAGGTSVEDATFTLEDAIFVPVNSLPEGMTFPDLDGNETTIIGTFGVETMVEDEPVLEPHLINSTGEDVDNAVEEAIYLATRDSDFASLFRNSDGTARFPTTNEIVNFIDDFGDVSSSDVADALFGSEGTGAELEIPDESSPTIEAEGDLFPHDDNLYKEPQPIFQFAFLINDGGAFDLSLCNEIVEAEVDILENSINLKKKGLLPVALLTTDDLDAQDVDPATVELGGVPAVKSSVKDVDGDGDDDVVFHFSVPALIAGGFLNEDTTSLTLAGEIEGEDVCVRGSASANVK